MRFYYLLIFCLLLLSCKKEGKVKEIINVNEVVESGNKISLLSKDFFKVKEHKNRAVVISNSLKIYNRNKKVIDSVKNLYGSLVEIDSISELKYDLLDSGERCNLYNFIRIKGNKIEGWVIGKDIFEYSNEERDSVLEMNGVKLQLKTTQNFDIGVYDEENEILSFCGEGNQMPLLIKNSLFDKEELIKVKGFQNLYPDGYLTLDAHDGWYDSINELSYINNVLNITITRVYQEGSDVIRANIFFNEKQSYAEVTKLPENCIEVILKKDSELGSIRNHACEKISLSTTIDNYVTSLQALDYTNCSPEFSQAFTNHQKAWLASKQITNKHPELRGEMHDLFDTINKTSDSTEFKKLVKDIWDTWADVEKAAKK
ncbi:hypothetical protein [Pseudofulvibacter geojedonensis]|uniref:Lysozyme inhibitor LprI N-terminal domain-containing protein n=1 Tax=Pseudofulvibacter geojedonensis TaxID=1123758 RepID=A0ABW3HZN1_9FLAO